MNAQINIRSLKGITQDSRGVKSGYLFAALPGSKSDGRDYIEAAIRNGASAVLAPKGTILPDLESVVDVALITDQNPRRTLALMAAEFYGTQPGDIVAVTGTNGKTSTVHFAQQLWKSQNIKAASLGTLSGSMTTPGPVALHAELADLAAAGITHLAIEASSHGLDQYRLDGVKLKAAAFTNLSHDHLDYHGEMDEYRSAKLRLFTDILEEGGTAVLNADSEEFNVLHNATKGRGKAGNECRVLSYGFAGEDLKILEITPTPQGQKVQLNILGQDYEMTLPLVGEFQVMNALCALGLVLAEDAVDRERSAGGAESSAADMNNSSGDTGGSDIQEDGSISPATAAATAATTTATTSSSVSPPSILNYVKFLEKLQGAPGRLQLVSGHPKGAAVYVDYAHTPDALENVLSALRPHTQGKLVCVFGCGGERDAEKRPLMGGVASRLADNVIVTDDNPRSENPEGIRAAILAATPDAQEISDRREAIQSAMADLQDGDVLLIAGKGHEQGQVFADYTDPFDDVEEAERAIEGLNE